MQAALPSLPRRTFVPPALRGVWRNVISLEVLFGLCFYSNAVQFLLPPLPIDLTILLALPTVPWALWILAREGIYTRAVPLLMAYVLFLAWPTFSMWWTPSHLLAHRYLIYYWSIDLWFIVVGSLIFAHNRERATRFLLVLLTLSLVVAVAGCAVYVVKGDFRFAFKDTGPTRLYNNWGYAVTAGAIVAFVATTRSRLLSLKQMFFAVGFFLCVFFLLIASSRGALLSSVAACAVGLAIGLPELGRGTIKVPKALVIALGLVGLMTAYIVYAIDTGGSFHTFDRFQKLFSDAQDPSMMQGPNRFAYYAAAVDFWFRAPLLGNGVGSFSHMFYGMDIVGAQPHNIFLELLTDDGLVGLGLFLLFLYMGLRHLSFRRLRDDALYLSVFLLFVSRWVEAMYSQELSAQSPMFLFLAILSLRSKPGTEPVAETTRRRRIRLGMTRRHPPRRPAPALANTAAR